MMKGGENIVCGGMQPILPFLQDIHILSRFSE